MGAENKCTFNLRIYVTGNTMFSSQWHGALPDWWKKLNAGFIVPQSIRSSPEVHLSEDKRFPFALDFIDF